MTTRVNYLALAALLVGLTVAGGCAKQDAAPTATPPPVNPAIPDKSIAPPGAPAAPK